MTSNRISGYSWGTAYPFIRDLGERMKKSPSLEAAAQMAANALCSEFEPSLSLARVYLTQPYGRLPESSQRFAEVLATEKGVKDQLRPTTSVLTLVGTYGRKPEWCQRSLSKGHQAIPLVSAGFVENLPMISRLFNELGAAQLALEPTQNHLTINKDIFNSIFFVQSAQEACDSKGRKIIPNQDFVAEQGIQSVLGMGGVYPDGAVLVLILFSRESLQLTQAQNFLPLMATLKTSTIGQVARGKIFD
jgi:hypothetical protein